MPEANVDVPHAASNVEHKFQGQDNQASPVSSYRGSSDSDHDKINLNDDEVISPFERQACRDLLEEEDDVEGVSLIREVGGFHAEEECLPVHVDEEELNPDLHVEGVFLSSVGLASEGVHCAITAISPFPSASSVHLKYPQSIVLSYCDRNRNKGNQCLEGYENPKSMNSEDRVRSPCLPSKMGSDKTADTDSCLFVIR
ncbi:hypothetical protein LINGRAHAP2_LOCUS7514 [Linum grandiflorum]